MRNVRHGLPAAQRHARHDLARSVLPGVVRHSGDREEIVLRALAPLRKAGIRLRRRLALRRRQQLAVRAGDRLVGQRHDGLAIGIPPCRFMPFHLALGHQPGRLRHQRVGLGLGRLRVIIHAGRIAQIAHHALADDLAVEIHLATVDRHDRDELTRPLAGIEDLGRRHKVPLDLLAQHAAGADDLDAGRGQRLALRQLVRELGRAVRQQMERVHLGHDPPILSDADLFLVRPFGAVVTVAHVLPAGAINVAVPLFILVAADHLRHDRPGGIRTVRHRARGVEVDRERVPYRVDRQILVERPLVDVLRAHPQVAPAAANGALNGAVIGVFGV